MRRSKITVAIYILYCIVCFAIMSGIIGCCISNDINPFKSCFGNLSVYGTYYMVKGNDVDKNVYFTLDNGKWKDESGFSGKCEISKGNITLYADSQGETVMASGSIGNGEMELNFSKFTKYKYIKQ